MEDGASVTIQPGQVLNDDFPVAHLVSAWVFTTSDCVQS
jgi:hypothetical protein